MGSEPYNMGICALNPDIPEFCDRGDRALGCLAVYDANHVILNPHSKLQSFEPNHLNRVG